MTEHRYLFYGDTVTPTECGDFLRHVFARNDVAEEAGMPKTPICIWGTHGIGKTAIVEEIARAEGFRFAYLAPAQFEEMGDLVGMPKVRERDDGRSTTTFSPPEWVPTEEGPGVLLIDDANRADIRILRGIMQLLQRYELVSWKLPPRWQIVLTANPDGGDYSVTTMDGAMLTRMLHVTMTLDTKAWARWAERSGVDPRGINFVLTYPEVIDGDRTTPRSLVQFFQMISGIDDLAEAETLVTTLASSCLGREAVVAFRSFIRNRLSKLVTPEEILSTKSFARTVHGPVHDLVAKDQKRVDILAVLSTRLVNYVANREKKLTSQQVSNLKAFLKMDFMPNDLRLVMAQDLVAAGGEAARLAADPEIGMLLLNKM